MLLSYVKWGENLKKTNIEIRREIVFNDLKYWQVAEALGLHDSNFTRLLRKELSEDWKVKVLAAIEKLSSNVEVSI